MRVRVFFFQAPVMEEVLPEVWEMDFFYQMRVLYCSRKSMGEAGDQHGSWKPE